LNDITFKDKIKYKIRKLKFLKKHLETNVLGKNKKYISNFKVLKKISDIESKLLFYKDKYPELFI